MDLPDETWKKMTESERGTALINSMSGQYIEYPSGGGMILMGTEAMSRMNNFIKEMINKYRD